MRPFSTPPPIPNNKEKRPEEDKKIKVREQVKGVLHKVLRQKNGGVWDHNDSEKEYYTSNFSSMIPKCAVGKPIPFLVDGCAASGEYMERSKYLDNDTDRILPIHWIFNYTRTVPLGFRTICCSRNNRYGKELPISHLFCKRVMQRMGAAHFQPDFLSPVGWHDCSPV